MMYISLEEKRLKKKKSEEENKKNSLNPLNWGTGSFPVGFSLHKS